jgi:hypothetical protein
MQQLDVVTQDMPERVVTTEEGLLTSTLRNFCNSCGEPIEQKMGYCMKYGATFEVDKK